MPTDQTAIKRIAELQGVKAAQADAYVRSLLRQLKISDASRVAAAVASLLEEGKPFFAKDVARRLRKDLLPAPTEPTAEPTQASSGDTSVEPVNRSRQTDSEARRDTRLRFEQWARNPHCLANTVSAVHGISMAEVATSEGIEPTMGQSPFALARGHNFERGLFQAGAKRLIAELAAKGVIPTDEAIFRDFRLRLNGGPLKRLDEARAQTSRLLEDIATGSPPGRKAILVAGATVSVPGGVMLPEAILVIDALVIRRDFDKPLVSVGEIKTYPDRGGYTEPGELAQARAQAGVYVHGLDLVCRELKIDDRVQVGRKGFLVLSRPGFNVPSVRADEDLGYQARRAERGFEWLRKVAADVIPAEAPERIDAVKSAATAYGENCISFCDRASLCRDKALEEGDPAVLGDEMCRFLGAVDLTRAIAILGGDKPKTKAERELERQFREAEVRVR